MKLPRLFTITCAVFALLLTACDKADNTRLNDGAAKPQKAYNWKMVTTWPKNYPGLGTSPEKFAKMVEKMSNGRLKIKVYGSGQLVPAFEVFDAVSRGTAELGHGASYYWKGKAPAAPLFTAYPFGLNAQEANGWLHYGGGMELWRELYEPFNLIPLAAGNTGVQMGGWFNREVNSVDDLQGLKIRMPGLGGEIISRAGAEAVNIPGGELYIALQTGVIDATEWVGPANDLAFGFPQIAKHYYYPGWHEPSATLEMIINKEKFDSLPADLQEIVTVAAKAINQDMLDDYTVANSRALDTLINEHKVDIRPYPDDVLEALYQASQEVMAEQASNDEMFNRVYQSVETFRVKARAYHKISEEAFYKMRNLVNSDADNRP